jgi:hypothetical protein
MEDAEHREIKMTIACFGGVGSDQLQRYRRCSGRYLDYDWLDLEVQNWGAGYDIDMEYVGNSAGEWAGSDGGGGGWGEYGSAETEDETMLDSGDD